MAIVNSDMTYDYRGTLSVKGRGNSTWLFPKKAYTLKLDSKSKVLSMPSNKRWCLLSGYRDRTMIRNAIISFGNWDECVDYMKAVERMKRVYLDKLNWMDAQISSW